MENKTFIEFVKEIDTETLKIFVSNIYSGISQYYNDRVGFGPNGSKEFIGSLLLARYDNKTAQKISDGIAMVFERKIGPLDFSNYMDDVVNDSSVPYETWSEVYRYLNDNHSWIVVHECASDNYEFSNSNPIYGDKFIFYNDNRKLVIKNSELGFFEELSFSNFIGFIGWQLGNRNINVYLDGCDLSIKDLLVNNALKFEMMYFINKKLDEGNIHFILRNEDSSLLISFSSAVLLVQPYIGKTNRLFEEISSFPYWGIFEEQQIKIVDGLSDIFLKPNLEYERFIMEYSQYTDLIESLSERKALNGQEIHHNKYGFGTVIGIREGEVFISFEDSEAGNMMFPLLDVNLNFVNYPRPKCPPIPILDAMKR